MQYGRVLSGQGFTLLAHALRNKTRWGKPLGRQEVFYGKRNRTLLSCAANAADADHSFDPFGETPSRRQAFSPVAQR